MKQTFTYKIMLAAFALFGAAGCSNDVIENEPDDMTASSGVEVQFSAGLGHETKMSYEPDGGAYDGFVLKWTGTDTDQTNYDRVGIFVVNHENLGGAVFGGENIRYCPTVSNTTSPLVPVEASIDGLTAGRLITSILIILITVDHPDMPMITR